MTELAYVVEVNEARLALYGVRDANTWWFWFRKRFDPINRITDTQHTIVGSLASVACEDKEGADWLAAQMIEHGFPEAAVKVKRAVSSEIGAQQ